MFVLARVALVLSLFATTLAQDEPVVKVEEGSLVGVTETFQESQFINVTKYVDIFKGIPFAEPPVEELRFEPPQPKQPWNGTYNATYFRDSCVQSTNSSGPMSEDCLHLNVFAPNPKISEGAAVMVYIHGGALIGGSAVSPPIQGHSLVAVGDVIIVTIQYRLNVLGFLTTADEVAPGNLGLKDQLLALQWIKQNIAAFGGNSENITIFGISAGSWSVNSHILSQQSTGLFNQAIMQSGPVNTPWSFSDDREMLRRQAFQLGQALGCTASESAALLNCLRSMNAADLLRASNEVSFRTRVVVDGAFLEDTPVNLYATGRYNHVNTILGTTADEGTLFLILNPLFNEYLQQQQPPPISRKLFEQLLSTDLSLYYGGNTELLANAIKTMYIDWSQADYEDADYFRAYVDFGTDIIFACGTNQAARFQAQGDDDVYMYQMTLVPSWLQWNISLLGPGWLGAGHGIDTTFTFGALFMDTPYSAFIPPGLLDEEKAFTVNFMRYWTNFAKTGNPNFQPETDPEFWSRFTIPELEYKVLDVNLTTSRALKSDECHFWNSYVPQLRTALGELDAVERDWKQAFSTWKYTDLEDWRDQFNRYKATNVD